MHRLGALRWHRPCPPPADLPQGATRNGRWPPRHTGSVGGSSRPAPTGPISVLVVPTLATAQAQVRPLLTGACHRSSGRWLRRRRHPELVGRVGVDRRDLRQGCPGTDPGRERGGSSRGLAPRWSASDRGSLGKLGRWTDTGTDGDIVDFLLPSRRRLVAATQLGRRARWRPPMVSDGGAAEGPEGRAIR